MFLFSKSKTEKYNTYLVQGFKYNLSEREKRMIDNKMKHVLFNLII